MISCVGSYRQRTPEERERTVGPKVANPGSRPFRLPLPSGGHLSRLLIDDEIERTEIEAKLIALLLAEVEPIELARDAVPTFNAVIRERDKASLEAWKTRVQMERMPQELRSFAKRNRPRLARSLRDRRIRLQQRQNGGTCLDQFQSVDSSAVTSVSVPCEASADVTKLRTFRAIGIAAYRSNGGTLENAQNIAAHASPRTSMLYDRRSDDISLDEIERILV